jgi:hypothetical protein
MSRVTHFLRLRRSHHKICTLQLSWFLPSLRVGGLMKTFLMLLFCALFQAQAANRVFYAGGAGKERFSDVHVLSDGTLLIAGGAQDLNWIAPSVPRIQIAATGVDSNATGSVGFILHCNADLSQILRVVHFPAGSVRDVFKLRTTETPGQVPAQATGALFISGSRDGAITDGYYLAKLNANFVSGVPSALSYLFNVRAAGDNKERQPWDVGGDGKVVYSLGNYFATDWAAIQRLGNNGTPEVVENWNAHWTAAPEVEWDGTPASSFSGTPALAYSAVVMKSTRRGSLRSTSAADFNLLSGDANGNTGRKGKFPDDYYFNSACGLSGTNTCPNTGPGYTNYNTQGPNTQRVGAIAVDRRNNDLYFGYSTKSTLPGGNPDFEPAVVAMRADGTLKWWDRLYQETTANSTPDQYVDGLALDYANNRAVVLARSHGNNTINLWNGNNLLAAPGLVGFQQTFSGTNGNIHLSWLGSFTMTDGKIKAASYLGELVEGSTNFGAAHPDALLGGWPNPNGGWPNLNTTRCGADAGYSGEISVFDDGSIAVLCLGRRSMTTTDAFQSMPRPNQTPMPVGSWNQFVRVYAANLASVKYSSLVVGAWDQSTGAGGDNTQLVGLAQANGHVIAVGLHTSDASNVANGNSVPSTDVPSWGAAVPTGQSALVARLSGVRLAAALPDLIYGNGFE